MKALHSRDRPNVKAGISVHYCHKRQPVLAQVLSTAPKSRSTLHGSRQPACLPLPLWAATLPSLLPKCASLARPVLQIVQYNPTFAVNFELDLHYCLEIQRPISSCRTHPNRRSLGSSIRRSVWVRVLRDHSNKATSTRRQTLLSAAIYGIVPKSLHAEARASRPKSPERKRTKSPSENKRATPLIVLVDTSTVDFPSAVSAISTPAVNPA